jgi:hypothetical protein
VDAAFANTDTTALHAVDAPLAMPDHSPAKNDVRPLHASDAADIVASHAPVRTSVKPDHADCAPDVIPDHSPVKNELRPFQIETAVDDTACHAETRNEVNDDHAFLPTSVCVKNQTSAPTTAVMATMIAPIGLAAMTAPKARQTVEDMVVTAFHASCAFLTRPIPPATLFRAAPNPPSSGMSVMNLMTPLAAPVMPDNAPGIAASPELTAPRPLDARTTPPIPAASGPSQSALFPIKETAADTASTTSESRLMTVGKCMTADAPTSPKTDIRGDSCDARSPMLSKRPLMESSRLDTASRTFSRKSTTGLSSSTLNALWNAVVKSPLLSRSTAP